MQESDLVATERNKRHRIGSAEARLLVDRLASDLSVASGGSFLPRSAASLGVHVGSFVCHFYKPQVADVVESAIASCTSGLALGSLLVLLAGNGC